MCRYWGLESSDPIERFSLESTGRRMRRAQVPYSNIGPPEKQIASKLVEAKTKLIMVPHHHHDYYFITITITNITLKANKESRRGLYGKSFKIRISLDGVNPPVYRDIICSGGIKLRTFAEKVIGPVFGWSLYVHSFLFTNPLDGSTYGQKINRKGLDDELLMPAHGFESISCEKVRLGDLCSKPGDFLFYVYDLGVRWEHRITVLEVSSPPSNGAHVKCLGGNGACPPEDGNGLDKNHPAFLTSSFRDGVLAIDTIYCEKNGNALYNLSIAEGGCLSDRNHEKYSESHKEAVSSTNKEKLNIKIFDWTHFDLGETNERLKVSLEVHGASCLCCVEGLYIKGMAVCAVCSNSSNLKHCSRCNATAYCSQACQKSDWKKHKLECAELKIAAEEVRARGEISFITGKKETLSQPDKKMYFTDATRKNNPHL